MIYADLEIYYIADYIEFRGYFMDWVCAGDMELIEFCIMYMYFD